MSPTTAAPASGVSDAAGLNSADDEQVPFPVWLIVARGESYTDRGEYHHAVDSYFDAVACCDADPSTPSHVTDGVEAKLRHGLACLRWTLASGGDPDHHLLPDEARDTVRKACLPTGYLLTIDGEVAIGCYPLTPEGCQEATREAELTAFDTEQREGLRHLAGRDDFDLVIYACDGRRATQVCRTQAMPGPGPQDGLSDGLLVVFRQLHAPVPWCWKPGIRWQAEAHLRWDERYHAIGICWVCDPASAKDPGVTRGWVDPCVDYLFVLDGWRRGGVATAIIDACRKRWPDLDPGEGATEEGVAFLKAYTANRGTTEQTQASDAQPSG